MARFGESRELLATDTRRLSQSPHICLARFRLESTDAVDLGRGCRAVASWQPAVHLNRHSETDLSPTKMIFTAEVTSGFLAVPNLPDNTHQSPNVLFVPALFAVAEK